MLQSRPNPASVAPRWAWLASVLLLVLLGIEFEAITHAHGGVWHPAHGIGLSAAPAEHGPDRPCAICRLADVSRSAATHPARIERSLAVSFRGISQTVSRPIACPEPVRSPRAPPCSVSR